MQPKPTTAAAQAPRTGRIARSAIAGVAVARVGAAHLQHKAQSLGRSPVDVAQASAQHEAKLGRILFGALSQLRGTALKASQLLSIELGFLPEATRAELARAHYQVTPLNRALVIKLMRDAFGQLPQTLFAHFDPQAFAAASLGQVHAATLHSGESVAVKLQYPGMAASVGSDMQLMRGLLKTLAGSTSAMPKAELIDRVMADIQHKLAEELDYLHEADQLIWFGQQLTHPALTVPQPVMALTSARVLTMQRLHGLHLNEWLATGPSQQARDYFGQLLFDVFLRCTFELHRLQADPHPGNYLFMPDGRLGLIDFGCTRALDASFCDAIGAAWSALLRTPADTRALQHSYQRLGMISLDLSPSEFELQLMPALACFQHWQRLPFAQAIYDFAQHPAPPRMSAAQHRIAVQHMQSVPPDLPYFDRSYLGLVQLLRQLGARVRTTNRWIQ